jgi:hypothetical protein
VTSQGSPLSRFRRAVSGTSATNALAAAAELGRLDLDDALRLVLLLSEDREKTPLGRYAGDLVAGLQVQHREAVGPRPVDGQVVRE